MYEVGQAHRTVFVGGRERQPAGGAGKAGTMLESDDSMIPNRAEGARDVGRWASNASAPCGCEHGYHGRGDKGRTWDIHRIFFGLVASAKSPSYCTVGLQSFQESLPFLCYFRREQHRHYSLLAIRQKKILRASKPSPDVVPTRAPPSAKTIRKTRMVYLELSSGCGNYLQVENHDYSESSKLR